MTASVPQQAVVVLLHSLDCFIELPQADALHTPVYNHSTSVLQCDGGAKIRRVLGEAAARGSPGAAAGRRR